MTFKKYPHLERWGTTEVEGIENGTCYVFPKLDGTNASIWLDGEIQAGSRKRHLSLDADNAGFLEAVLADDRYKAFFEDHPGKRLFGEWLVPHSLKTYRDDTWRKFYVFDVAVDDPGAGYTFLPYTVYQNILEEYDLDYIPAMAVVRNGTYEQFLHQATQHNDFLIQDGKGMGEGVVIKNYDWVNRFGRQTWAKIVTSEFKEKHKKAMGGTEIQGKQMVEAEIAEEFVTEALVEKVFAKIQNEDGWSSKFIPRLLHTVFYDVIREDSWSFVKKHKNPKIDFKTLQYQIFSRVKNLKPELF